MTRIKSSLECLQHSFPAPKSALRSGRCLGSGSLCTKQLFSQQQIQRPLLPNFIIQSGIIQRHWSSILNKPVSKISRSQTRISHGTSNLNLPLLDSLQPHPCGQSTLKAGQKNNRIK